MENWRSRLSKLTGKTSLNMKPVVKKAVITAVAVTSLSMSGAAVTQAQEPNLTTVYYVYLNDKYIGTISDKNAVENLVQEQLQEAQKTYKDYQLALGSELTYVPEQVLGTTTDAENQEVINELDSALTIQAEAAALVIDGKTVAYVENQEAAEEAIKKLKLLFVKEDQLKQIEAIKEADGKSLPPLKENETRILDVRLSKEVSVSDEKIAPTEIISADQAVKLLQKGTLEEKKYQVKEGDVLGKIASAHNLKLNDLLSLNPGVKEDTLLKIGQELNVTVFEPFVNVVVDKEVYQKETVPHAKEVVMDSSMFKGDTKVKQEGKDGMRGVTYVISEQNGKIIKKETGKSEVLQEPVKHIVIKGSKVVPSRGEGSFLWPASGGYISSPMGYRGGKMHKGIDIARPSNYTIKAADNGVVVSAGWDGGYGNKVVVDHKNGFRTVYAHLASISVSPGQTVPRGSKLGVMGSTGNSTGVHLHFEVYKNGSMQNPLQYLRR